MVGAWVWFNISIVAVAEMYITYDSEDVSYEDEAVDNAPVEILEYHLEKFMNFFQSSAVECVLHLKSNN